MPPSAEQLCLLRERALRKARRLGLRRKRSASCALIDLVRDSGFQPPSCRRRYSLFFQTALTEVIARGRGMPTTILKEWCKADSEALTRRKRVR